MTADLAQRPIGVFDSGVGGLSVLRPLHALLPHEHLIYLADSAHMPYGDKPPEAVRARVLAVAAALLALGCKALVVACNTATAAAIGELRARHALPIIGMEPGIKPAVARTRSGVVGVLATASTVHSARFAHLTERFGHGARLLIQPCPGLVEQVERGHLLGGDTETLLRRYLAPLLERGADTLVLGCTHYPFLLPLIEGIAGPDVTVIDTGPAVARQVQRQLTAHDLLNPTSTAGTLRFFTSGPVAEQQTVLSRLWGSALKVEPLPEAAAG